jgi:L-alanine-DL-glutamate epimerase-like enolase superfamily enzyme
MTNKAPLVRTSVNAAEGDLAAGIEAKRRQGFQVLTLKVGDDPVADAELTLAVAAQAQPGDRILADANGGWLLHEAMTYIHRIQDAPGVMIEQPCETVSDCVELGKRTNHPIVLDESIDDLGVLSCILTLKQVSAVNLKIERIGGITKTRQMRDLCLKAGCAMFVQEVGGAEITYAATTHLAHTIPEHLLLVATTIKVDKSLASGAPVMDRGRVRCNDGPGLGLEINADMLGDPQAMYK